MGDGGRAQRLYVLVIEAVLLAGCSNLLCPAPLIHPPVHPIHSHTSCLTTLTPPPHPSHHPRPPHTGPPV